MIHYFEYKTIITTLRKAYVAACKGLGLANKLKANGKAHKSRILARMNKLRAELKRIEKQAFMPFDFVVYSGIVLPLVKQSPFKLYVIK